MTKHEYLKKKYVGKYVDAFTFNLIEGADAAYKGCLITEVEYLNLYPNRHRYTLISLNPAIWSEASLLKAAVIGRAIGAEIDMTGREAYEHNKKERLTAEKLIPKLYNTALYWYGSQRIFEVQCSISPFTDQVSSVSIGLVPAPYHQGELKHYMVEHVVRKLIGMGNIAVRFYHSVNIQP